MCPSLVRVNANGRPTCFSLARWLTFLCASLNFFYLHCAGLELHVSNNGPGILDSKITFSAEVTGEGLQKTYFYEFEDNVKRVHNEVVKGDRKVNITFQYSSAKEMAGTYRMTVKLYRSFVLFHELLATETTDFNLTDYINGNLTVSGGAGKYIPVGQNINVTFNLEDRTGFFEHSQMSYAWEVNGVQHVDLKNILIYNATKEESVDIHLVLNAVIMEGNSVLGQTVKWGFFDLSLEAIRPVSNVTVIGNVFLQQGDIINFEVNCNGSEPYQYCVKVFPPNKTQPNMSCDERIVTNRCNFPVMHYFSGAGVYHIGVDIGNHLNNVTKTVEIHISDVSRKAQLSTVIVPIVCSLLAFVIIVVGVAVHIHQRKRYSIEVADFDFQQPVPLVEKTFLERLKDSFKAAMKKSCDEQVEVKRPPSDERTASNSTLYGSTSKSGDEQMEVKTPPSDDKTAPTSTSPSWLPIL